MADLPRPDRPLTRTASDPPARVAPNAWRRARTWASRPTKCVASEPSCTLGAGARSLGVTPSRRKISAAPGRLSGSAASIATQSAFRSSGTPSTQADGAVGSTVYLSVKTSIAVPLKGGRPTSAS